MTQISSPTFFIAQYCMFPNVIAIFEREEVMLLEVEQHHISSVFSTTVSQWYKPAIRAVCHLSVLCPQSPTYLVDMTVFWRHRRQFRRLNMDLQPLVLECSWINHGLFINQTHMCSISCRPDFSGPRRRLSFETF